MRQQALCALISLTAMHFVAIEAETVIQAFWLLGSGRYKLFAEFPKRIQVPFGDFKVWVDRDDSILGRHRVMLTRGLPRLHSTLDSRDTLRRERPAR